ncbi:MAG: transposase [Pyrinomonadaceae bacterium]|nr:transposase [Pyrinomonadaceae bacterium]
MSQGCTPSFAVAPHLRRLALTLHVHCTLDAQEFIRRFLQHVLPPRFSKVRYYGLLSHRQQLAQARNLLAPKPLLDGPKKLAVAPASVALRCPNCGGLLVATQTLKPHRERPP